MIKGIAFDFDHTLYDRDRTYERMVDDFCTCFARELRGDVTRAQVLQVMQACDRSGIYKAGHWEGIYADTVAAGIFAEAPTYESYYQGFMESHYPGAIVLYDDTLSTLVELKRRGYQVGILTNGPSGYQRDKVGRVHLEQYVDALVVGGELAHQKPHASAFHHICRVLGCRPEEVVYVGDHPYNDVNGAEKAGLIPVWMRSVGYWPEDLPAPRYAIDRLGRLPELLAAMDRKG